MAARKYTKKLIATHKKLAFECREKEKRAAELLIANKELVFQNEEKEKRAAELVLANEELIFQNEEKEKRAAELVIANHELAFQNEEKEKRAAEFVIANQELAFQNEEKEKRAAEQLVMYNNLKKAEEFQEQYIHGLEEMMFMISHKIRQPVAHILGLSNMIGESINSEEVMTQLIGYIKKSALSLDAFTKQMTAIVNKLVKKKQPANPI